MIAVIQEDNFAVVPVPGHTILLVNVGLEDLRVLRPLDRMGVQAWMAWIVTQPFDRLQDGGLQIRLLLLQPLAEGRVDSDAWHSAIIEQMTDRIERIVKALEVAGLKVGPRLCLPALPKA